MNRENFINKANIIRITILITQVVFYILFIVSHFLVWGYTIYPWSLPLTPNPFIGVETYSGWSSFIWLNGFFVIGFFNYLYFYFVKWMKKYYLFQKTINGIVMICGLAVFIKTIVGIHLDWQFDIYLAQLVFGFYLWLSAVTITFGVLCYLNFKFKREV